MNTTQSTSAAVHASDGTISRALKSAVVLVGPALSVSVVLSQVGGPWVSASQLGMVLSVVLLFWSPVFFSIPALLTQDGRDQALPQLNGALGSLLRGIVLTPWLLLSPNSSVRTETACSLVGLIIGVMLALPYLPL